MVRPRCTLISILLLFLLAAVFAAPNGSSAAPGPASIAGSFLAPATVLPNPKSNAESQLQHHLQADLKKRQASSNSTASATGGMLTGAFTAADGGVYLATSQSGYVLIDGKTLYPGQGALIGNEMVSEGSSGLVANGVTVVLTAASTSPPAAGGGSSSLPASSSAVSPSGSSTFVSTSTEAASTTSSAQSHASTASSKALAPTQGANHMMVAVGGFIGLMVL
ncbi:hypothetical protein LTR91_020898 [Friedmanniomyces endolithicus]|uniref:Uncharacterized protein n=1 Tax=Friedmanniomyces endolithicus TaxID=329885 RepID=A0AAN6H8V3_9PEZI|nr:hypothetical protein LTR35_006663 [Friedmanniomyces endolithicus]KAK0297073.1 hypothetical protein LTS00_004352 [Friedmanniomyces endolithicus]KAK0320717.1 hypothetical protein LTR82_008430 [Friedmanniomyces endolithicus]KAK0928122.1 hypothetical protein LTR57_002856 [Friedmanniomyces endolithicus]KAK0959326.1 hypothetical protein LTR91_020898 [Friedmanniomyces endolithicus]